MNKTLARYLLLPTFIALLIISLFGCVPIAVEEPPAIERIVTVESESSLPSRITLKASTRTETELIVTEDIPLNNCGGNSKLNVEIEREREFIYTITDKDGHAFGADSYLVGMLEREYEVTNGKSEKQTHTIHLETKPDSYVIYTIAWKERWVRGDAEVQTKDQVNEVPYKIRNGLTFEVEEVRDMGCE